MNTPAYSGRGSVTICCLLTIGSAILPLTMTGQTPGTGPVWVQFDSNGAHVPQQPPALAPSSAGGILLGIARRIIAPQNRPARTHAAPSSRANAVVTPSARGDVVSLQIYLPAAHHVAVAGDGTDWRPVDMVRQQGGWWVVFIPLTRTVSRLHMRSDDSAWGAIPGLPATPDEYGGTVSLLVVPEEGTPHT